MPKFKKVQLVLAGIFTILFFRFYHLQIYQHSKYEEKAGNNSVRKISIHAPVVLFMIEILFHLQEQLPVFICLEEKEFG